MCISFYILCVQQFLIDVLHFILIYPSFYPDISSTYPTILSLLSCYFIPFILPFIPFILLFYPFYPAILSLLSFFLSLLSCYFIPFILLFYPADYSIRSWADPDRHCACLIGPSFACPAQQQGKPLCFYFPAPRCSRCWRRRLRARRCSGTGSRCCQRRRESVSYTYFSTVFTGFFSRKFLSIFILDFSRFLSTVSVHVPIYGP